MSPAPRFSVWIGLLSGLVGVAILIAPGSTVSHNASRSSLTGIAILLISSFIWSAGSLYSRAIRHTGSPFLAVAQQMLCGGGLMLIVSALIGEPARFDPTKVSALSLGAFTYLVVVGAIVGYTAYIYLLRHCDPAKVATYAYVNPVVAVVLGAVFADEKLTTRTLVGAALIIGAVALVIMAQQFKTRPTPPIEAAVDCAK
jgi:drug/metabolite transporter (DMT)-like permease